MTREKYISDSIVVQYAMDSELENHRRKTGIIMLKGTVEDCQRVSNDDSLPIAVMKSMLRDSRSQIKNIMDKYKL